MIEDDLRGRILGRVGGDPGHPAVAEVSQLLDRYRDEVLRRVSPESGGFDVRPVEGESYEGRQWGYLVYHDEVALLHVTTGSTGPCWNVEDAAREGRDDAVPLHSCDLDHLIGALRALRSSEADRQHRERWDI